MVFQTLVRRHSTLNDFLSKTTTSKHSTVYKGTLFEYQTMTGLSRLEGMQLTRVGGAGDGGIDLRGQWTSPSFHVNLVVQCKNVKTGITPEHIRSLIGVTSQYNKNVVGILASSCTEKPYTRSIIQQVTKSSVPLGLAMIQDTTIKSLLFNKRALSILKGLEISTQFDSEGNECVFIDIIKNNK
ncbi:hypothetical protein K501DRAFT_263359 [Backusella circina FSU 941]|nr:hypothetical protein K501DRAFT_263359 [Backusella circina FSU 941]